MKKQEIKKLSKDEVIKNIDKLTIDEKIKLTEQAKKTPDKKKK